MTDVQAEAVRDPFAALAEAEERAAFLAAAARQVSGSLDLTQTRRQGARACVPRLADWAQLLLLDGNSSARVMYLRAGDAHPVETSVAAPKPALSGTGRVLATGRSELLHVSQQGNDGLTALVPDPEIREQVNELRPADVLGVALTARGTTFGTLTLVRRAGSGFNPEDVRLAEELAAHLALALDAARRYSERSAVASVLQASLRPPELPVIPGARVAARYRAADSEVDIGGDFYDVWRSGSGAGWSVVLGDVSGKGVAAAVVTGQARHTVRGAAHLDPRPAAVLDALNSQLVESGSGRFVTAVYIHATAHPDGGWWLDVGSAGHPAPLLLRADGTVEAVAVKGLLAGVVAGTAYTPVRVHLAPKETVLLFTDGVTEADRNSISGLNRLIRLAAGYATAPVEALAEAVEMEAVERSGQRRRDDLAIVAVKASA